MPSLWYAKRPGNLIWMTTWQQIMVLVLKSCVVSVVKNRKTKKGVKEHENKVHRNINQLRCPEKTCKFGTQSIQLYKTHRVRHHSEERERSFRCKKCKKCFDGKNLLNKHIKSRLCTVEKNFECVLHKPSRWFKTAEGRDRHYKVYHTGYTEKLQCVRCKEWYGSKTSLMNHQKWHRSIDLLARAKRLRLARESKLKEKDKETASSGSRPTTPLLSPRRKKKLIKKK